MYKIGFGRTDITPTESVPLSGMGVTSKRMSRVVRDELYATCVAITDEQDTTVLLYTMDLQQPDGFIMSLRPLVAEQTGVPETNIFFCCTHTHAGPHVGNLEKESILRYREQLPKLIPQAAVDAMADRSQSDLYMGQVETERMNFVKHYKYLDENGVEQYFGDNYGVNTINETTRHMTEADPTMHLLKAVRQGKKDIVLANWRAHPHCNSGVTKYDLSADFISDFRDFMEKDGVLFAYYQGAAGNINNKSRITDEEWTRESRAYGRLMAQFARKGLENMTEVPYGPIKTKRFELTLPVNKPSDEMMKVIDEVRACWQSTVDFQKATAIGAHLGIRSPYHANSLYFRYHGLPETEDSELNAVAFGDHLALVSAPNELFDAISVYVEDHAPYDKVLCLCYCNGYTGYIPTAYGFEYTSYETDCCHFNPGCGEIYRDTFLKMLGELK